MNNSEAEKDQKADEILHSNSPNIGIEDKLQNLLTDPNFLKLKRTLNNSNNNLFSILAASHLERWHSAFIRWILDPMSETGLDDFPLKRFLCLALKLYPSNSSVKPPELSLGDVEKMNLESSEFTNEEGITPPGGEDAEGGDQRFIDVYGEFHAKFIGDDKKAEPKRIQIIIENKVKALEGNNQTKEYANWANSAENKFKPHIIFLIFLAPKIPLKLTGSQFVKIRYQDLVDAVLLPCLKHPDLTQESKYWLEQYLLNLGMPINKQNPDTMAKTNKEICKKIYDAHRDVLNEIFSSENDEELPQGSSESQTKKHYGKTLQDLVENKQLNLTDKLHMVYNGKHFSASLLQNDDGSIGIVYNGIVYPNPSAACREARGTLTADGWKGWEVIDENGKSKKTLYEIREQFLGETISP